MGCWAEERELGKKDLQFKRLLERGDKDRAEQVPEYLKFATVMYQLALLEL